MNEKDLETHLVKMVKEFASKRNDAEKHIYEQHEAQQKARPSFSSEQERVTWEATHTEPDLFEKFSKLLAPLFDTYCTSKKRVYGGTHGYSFGFPVKFNGIENPVGTGVELKNKNRAEIYVKTSTQFQDEYLFVLLCKTNEWKIDSYKNRRYGNEKWSNEIL
ncbi:MAG: RhsIA family immunity protein [Methylobacillus sp.]|jgi:hypothetical protein|nr:RhsIA family immunity protein [Methylobacillus sp.]